MGKPFWALAVLKYVAKKNFTKLLNALLQRYGTMSHTDASICFSNLTRNVDLVVRTSEAPLRFLALTPFLEKLGRCKQQEQKVSIETVVVPGHD